MDLQERIFAFLIGIVITVLAAALIVEFVILLGGCHTSDILPDCAREYEYQGVLYCDECPPGLTEGKYRKYRRHGLVRRAYYVCYDESSPDDEGTDDPYPPLSVCDDCSEATKGGCDGHGGEGKKVTDGTTRTVMADGSVDCIKDCADGSVAQVTCR